jgi:hypothetical protein
MATLSVFINAIHKRKKTFLAYFKLLGEWGLELGWAIALSKKKVSRKFSKKRLGESRSNAVFDYIT